VYRTARKKSSVFLNQKPKELGKGPLSLTVGPAGEAQPKRRGGVRKRVRHLFVRKKRNSPGKRREPEERKASQNLTNISVNVSGGYNIKEPTGSCRVMIVEDGGPYGKDTLKKETPAPPSKK